MGLHTMSAVIIYAFITVHLVHLQPAWLDWHYR